MAAFSFSLRDKWGLGAAAGVALCLGLGGWAYSSMGSGGNANAAPMRPRIAATAATASLDLPAGDVRPAAAANSPASVVAGEKLVVHVAGSVKNPGVYTLKPGDRINDAVKAAGGFKANAQQDALNLADTVRDADQIFVPAQVSPTAPAKTKPGAQTEAADNDYSVPSARFVSVRHPLIVRGTPVRLALTTAAAGTSPAHFPTDAPMPASDDAAPAADAAEAPAPPDVAPAPQGRVLGRPAPAPVEGSGDAAEGDPQEAAPIPAPYPVSVGKSRRAAGSPRKTSGSVGKSTKSGGAGGAKFKNPGDGVVHLNSAGAAELEKLPGVGPAMSARILEYRHQIGGFKSVEQILDVKGIGDKKFAKMRPFLAL